MSVCGRVRNTCKDKKRLYINVNHLLRCFLLNSSANKISLKIIKYGIPSFFIELFSQIHGLILFAVDQLFGTGKYVYKK